MHASVGHTKPKPKQGKSVDDMVGEMTDHMVQHRMGDPSEARGAGHRDWDGMWQDLTLTCLSVNHHTHY